MTKVGILTCSSSVQDTVCSSYLCFEAVHGKTGEFARYEDEVQVQGITSCAGCAGSVFAAKILRRVASLKAAGAEVIHMAKCMSDGCPFATKYEKLIREAFPNLPLVRGTHPSPVESEEDKKRIGAAIVATITELRPTGPEIVEGVRRSAQCGAGCTGCAQQA
jgi:Predicted metal-binding protein